MCFFCSFENGQSVAVIAYGCEMEGSAFRLFALRRHAFIERKKSDKREEEKEKKERKRKERKGGSMRNDARSFGSCLLTI